MNKEKERENFSYYDAHSPERKMELVDGRLIVGNSIEGSRLLLDHILRGWSIDAAAAIGTIEQWIAALCDAYGLRQPPKIDGPSIGDLERQVAGTDYPAPNFTLGDEGDDAGHHRIREHLYYSLWELGEALGGEALGRDFVMRLGENGFTPDIVFFKSGKLNTLHENYLQGPAELVIEVVRPAHRDYDNQVKRGFYARGGVPEYLIVDPERRHVEFLRLVNRDYVVQRPDADGCYRPQSIPGLAIATKHLWAEGERFSLRGKDNPFIVTHADHEQPDARRIGALDDGLGWGKLEFAPRLDLKTVRLRFAEYIAWAPESKFEFFDGRIQISGREGVRNVTGMLLATVGLAEACHFAPAAAWLEALQRRRDIEVRDGEIRREWRARAATAAELLRTKYHPERIAITGDLLSPQPLGFWSELTLAVRGLSGQDTLHVYEDLSAMDVALVEADGTYFQQNLEDI